MKTDFKKLTAEIIPCLNLPQNIMQVFSYAIPEKFKNKIKIGTMVKVPFGRKIISGIVYDVKEKSLKNIRYKLRNIYDLEKKDVSLSEEQIKLSEYVSNYYKSSISLVIKTMTPQITKKDARKKIEINPDPKISNIDALKTGKIIKEIKRERKVLFIHNMQSEKHDLYYHIMKNILIKNGQALLLLPESFDIYNFADFYVKKFGETKTAIMTSGLTKNQYFNEWKKIKNGSAKIIIGTRQAVFASFENLKLIIIDDEHSSSYKQWDMNPRYSGINIAEKLAEIWKAKIILSSPAPSVESYYKAKSKKFSKIEFYKNRGNAKYFEVINIEDERKGGNYSVLSESLKENLLSAIYKRKQVIIFIPRLGENTVTQCKDCGYTAECKDCGGALISQDKFLYCQRCKEKIELIKECPKCKGQNINSFGYGSGGIEKEIKKLFDGKNIKIKRLDSNAASQKGKQLKIYKDFINGKIDILTGTQMVMKNWNMENLAVVAILSPEIMFNQSDFRSKEKSFQFLFSEYNKTNEKQKTIIQTRKPDNNIFKLIKNKRIDEFYDEELKNRTFDMRTKFGYPPFSHLIKFIYKDTIPKKCEKEAEKLYEILRDKIKNNKNLSNEFEIISPFPASNYKEYGKYRWFVIMKSTCKNIKKRDELLNSVKKNWTAVDVDPDSVF